MEKRKNKEDHIIILEAFVEEIKNDWGKRGISVGSQKRYLDKENILTLYVVDKEIRRRSQKITITTTEKKDCCCVQIDFHGSPDNFFFYTNLENLEEDIKMMKKYIYFSSTSKPAP